MARNVTIRPAIATKLVLAAVAVATAAFAVPAVINGGSGGGACDINATTGNFSSQVSSANPGQTVCLASGSYGTWSGVNKGSPGVTIKEQSGATATFSDLTLTGPASNGGFTLDGI